MSEKDLMEYKRVLATMLYRYRGIDRQKELGALSQLSSLWDAMSDDEQDVMENISAQLSRGEMTRAQFYSHVIKNEIFTKSSMSSGLVPFSLPNEMFVTKIFSVIYENLSRPPAVTFERPQDHNQLHVLVSQPSAPVAFHRSAVDDFDFFSEVSPETTSSIEWCHQ